MEENNIENEVENIENEIFVLNQNIANNNSNIKALQVEQKYLKDYDKNHMQHFQPMHPMM